MPGSSFDIFGLRCAEPDAAVVIVPVPYCVTASYGSGSQNGPRAIERASSQLDFDDRRFGPLEQRGVFMRDEPETMRERAAIAREAACRVVERDTPPAADLEAVNASGAEMVRHVGSETAAVLDRGRVPGVLGGEHAVAEGAILEAASRYPGLGLLQIDAHMDLRDRYQGFDHSHASVMHNALHASDIGTLVQFGIRDYCGEEAERARSDPRVRTYFADDVADRRFRGESFASIAGEALFALPEAVWVTFDIDGLEPDLCPGTGTPVPGGLSFQEASFLLHRLVATGRRIVGFDLTEVAPSPGPDDRDSIDAIVGARVLARLCGAATA